MEVVAEKYKQTVLGLLPCDWLISELSEVVKSERPISYGIVQTGRLIPNGVKCVRVIDIVDGSIEVDKLITTSIEISNSYKRTILEEGDLFIALRGKIGTVAIASKKLVGANLTRGVALISLKEIYSNEYLRQQLTSETSKRVLEGRLNGSALKELAISVIRKVPVALPPTKAEQIIIATALSDADNYIASLQKLIAKKRLIKQGTMQKLLEPKSNWKKKKISDLFEISGGYSATREQLSDEGYCYLHYGDIHGSKKTFIDTDKEFPNIPKFKIDLKKINKNSLLNNGDVVFVDASEDGEGVSRHVVIINEGEIPFISGLHTIIAKGKTSQLDLNFKKYCFQSKDVKDQFGYFAVGTKVSGVSKSSIKNISLSFPEKAEQIQIASILSDMDAEIELLESQLSKAQSIKQGMMQQLLTGKIRLV